MLNEPDYAEIKVFNKRWGDTEDQGSHFNEIPMRQCKQKELGLGPEGFDDPESKFFPIAERHF